MNMKTMQIFRITWTYFELSLTRKAFIIDWHDSAVAAMLQYATGTTTVPSLWVPRNYSGYYSTTNI